jgi:rhodanese-related sulfurtransferase
MTVQNLSSEAVFEALRLNQIRLVDVREPHEFAQYHIAQSQNLPLSGFDPSALSDDSERPIVLMCAGGIRSLQAMQIAQDAGLNVNAHLAKGIYGWVADGYEVER